MRDLVGKHLDQSESEQVRRVSAIRPGCHFAACSGRAPGQSVTRRAAIREAGAKRRVFVDVPGRVSADPRSLSLVKREFPLEELPAAADRARRIPFYQVNRRPRRKFVTATRTDLLGQGFPDRAAWHMGCRLSNIRQLGTRLGTRQGANETEEPY